MPAPQTTTTATAPDDRDATPAASTPSGNESVVGAFHRSVDEGVVRLNRSTPSLLATGVVGGVDVSIGLFAFLVVLHDTGSRLLAALAFGIGFVALTLARSELFTENFLVPVAAVIARKASVPKLARLWAGTAACNFLGAFVVMGLVTAAFPHLHPLEVAIGTQPIDLGITWQAFADAILGGVAITLMTWMERSTESIPAKLLAAVSIAFVLVAAPLQHAVVLSAEAFGALTAGAPFGYLDWLGTFAFAALGNAIGGIGLVTVLRLVQVGPKALQQERARPAEAERATPDPIT